MKQRRSQDGVLDERRADSRSASSARARKSRAKLRVLLIEDNEDHVMLARRALEERGHMVTAVVGGAAAADALGKEQFDVVAADYQLPDITGLEALRQIRERDKTLPVVMVTGWGSEQVAVEALKEGAADYVVKTPGYERELARALELAVEKACTDATETALRSELARRARTDSLTGLLNRGEMERLLTSEIRRASRRRRVFSFALADVDLLKAINDKHGHAVGDAVLCHIATVLRRSIRSSDSVARWGGDEFAVLLPGAGFSGASAFAHRLARLTSGFRPVSASENLPSVTVSVGIACVTDAVSDVFAVLNWADRALYDAKVGGRNKARVLVVSQAADVESESDGCGGTPGTPGERPDGNG